MDIYNDSILNYRNITSSTVDSSLFPEVLSIDTTSRSSQYSILEDSFNSGVNENSVIPQSLQNTEPRSGYVTGGSEEGVLLNEELEKNPSLRKISFVEVNNPVEAEQTWLIVHGWNDFPEGSFLDIATEISQTNPEDRVLLLNWTEAAYNKSDIFEDGLNIGEGNVRAATWISPVAEFAVKALNDFYGIDFEAASENLNLIGHSLGVFVNSEMGRIYRDGINSVNQSILGNEEGVRTITVLEAPLAQNLGQNPFSNQSDKDIYDLDGRLEGIQVSERFADVSVFSRAFIGEKSIIADRELAMSADEVFQMDFGTISELTDFGREHARVLESFPNMINQSGLIGDLLGVRAYKFIDELSIEDFAVDDRGLKGIIDVNEDNEVKLLIGKSKTDKADDIVIGNFVNQEINDAYTGEGNDIFFGESGDDRIIGNDDDDILFGGRGKDELDGGSGVDTFVFGVGDGSFDKEKADIIKDFEVGTDRIGLVDVDFGELSFQEFHRSGLFGSTTDTAIIVDSEIIALVKGTTVEEIQQSEYFVSVNEEKLRIV